MFCSLAHFTNTALGLEFPDDNSTSAINTMTGSGGATSNHNHHDIIGSSSSGGGGRNRAFSFECFAFGINADEPLPPLEHPTSTMNVTPMTHVSSCSNISQKDIHNNNNNNYHSSKLYDSQHPHVPEQRPRGDSIIFDPASFQDGGIHELLPGLIEQQQQQGNDFTSASSSTMHHVGANIVPSTQPFDKKQQHQRPPYSQQQKSITTTTSRPPTVPTAHSKLQQPMNVPSSSNFSYPTATTTSSAIPTKSQPPFHPQQRKSSSTSNPSTTTANNAQSQQQQQDMVTTINSDGTTTTISLELCNKDGRIGIYLPDARIARIARFHAKRSNRIWRKRIKYDCRKKLADSRPRIKGRFVKRTDMDE